MRSSLLSFMNKICIFYHCLFYLGDPPQLLTNACDIVGNQMNALQETGLLDAASEMVVGINGGNESEAVANILIPQKARKVLHGLQCRNECRTILEMEQWSKTHPDWYILYFHAKGSTHAPNDGYSTAWRECMMKGVVKNWRTCIADLDSGCDAVGSHWMVPPATPPGQHIFAGTFFWVKSSFVLTLPSIMERHRIKFSGIDSIESRYESEVWIGNGPKVPIVKDYHGPNWNPGKIGTCTS